MIELPPHMPSVPEIDKITEKVDRETIDAAIGRINDEFLYWSDVKYRAKSLGISAEELWQVVKHARQKTDIKIKGFENLHFSLSNAMLRHCHALDMNFGGSSASSGIFPDDKTARELCLVSSVMEEAIASSQMEGAATTREVAKNMLRKKIAPKDKSQRMILNNYNTINFIRDHAKDDLTPAYIMQIHAMMTENALDVPDAAGRFRRDDENIVVGNVITGETVHTPPPASCLDEFAVNLCAFFNERTSPVFIHPVIKGIILHFLIAYYHPFSDGNGRTARALFYWYMMRNGYGLIQYLAISRIIKESKKSYEKAFLFTESDSNDMGYFITYNLDVLNRAFRQLQSYLNRKEQEKKKADRLLRLGNVTPRQAGILNLFIENADLIMTSVDVISRFAVTPKTAKSDLRDLVAKGYLSEIALNGRTQGYIRTPAFPSLIAPAD